MGKLRKCKHCSHEIAKKAKICPSCGGKNKSTSVLLKMFLVFLVLAAIGSLVDTDTSKTSKTAVPDVDISEIKKSSPDFPMLFYAKVNLNNGASRVRGFYAVNQSDEALKQHCSKQMYTKGKLSVCFYYDENIDKPGITQMGSKYDVTRILKTVSATDYQKRVDIYPSGQIDISSK
jgi:hypothetical protein